MKLFLFITIVFATPLPSYYHQFENVNFQTFGCGEVTTVLETPKIEMLTINPNAPYKAFVLFGEHARELISPETGIHLVEQICQQKYDISKYQIKLILNLNPQSRERVEQGEYCLRLNENGIDLNRNYDAHFQVYEDKELQTNSGPEPFSEPETKAVRDILKEYNPDIYLSIHSGSAGLYTPHAYSTDETDNHKELMEIINVIQEKHCPQCEVGVSGISVGYLAYGTALDYAFDELNIKHSFLYEIYHDSVNVENDVKIEQMKEKKSNDQKSFLQLKEDDPQDCFKYFNPGTEEEYNWYVQNWSDAIIDTLNLSVQQLEKEKQPNDAQSQDQSQDQQQQQQQQQEQSQEQQNNDNSEDGKVEQQKNDNVLSHNY